MSTHPAETARLAPIAIHSPEPSLSEPSLPGAPHFDRIARPYRWLEYLSFGPLLQRTRTHWLHEISHCRSALVLGDGDGRFTAALLRANPKIRVHAVDGSSAMLRLLEKRCRAQAHRLTVQQADLRQWSPAPARSGSGYDLIATHFFLDCLTSAEAASLATRLAPAVRRDAIWLVSEFAIPPTRFGRWIAAPIVTLLYRAFSLLTGLRVRALPNHSAALESSGWRQRAQHARLGGLLTSQLWKRTQRSNPNLPAGM